MRKEERYKGVLNWFNEHVPVAETELHYDNPYQLLIAVILSAQCTDKRVRYDHSAPSSGIFRPPKSWPLLLRK